MKTKLYYENWLRAMKQANSKKPRKEIEEKIIEVEGILRQFDEESTKVEPTVEKKPRKRNKGV